jgi:hypothetical protein
MPSKLTLTIPGYTATIAAAAIVALAAPTSLVPAVLCHNGGASQACRRFLWRKSRNSVALLLSAAVTSGDNLANSANFNANRNIPIIDRNQKRNIHFDTPFLNLLLSTLHFQLSLYSYNSTITPPVLFGCTKA